MNWVPQAGVALGSWLLEHPLGSGATSTVWRVRHQTSGLHGAMKVQVGASLVARERVRREARILGGLNHPSLPRLLDTLEQGAVIAVVMEQIDGSPLDVIAGDGQLPDGRVAALGADLCSVVAAAHSHGVAHRDLKPEHVLVSGRGQLHVLDFGLARSETDPRLTQPSERPPGTPPYVPPEWWRSESFDPFQADAWSLGACLYTLCTGRLPLPGDTSLDPGHPRTEALRDVIRGLTRHDPRRRLIASEAEQLLRPVMTAAPIPHPTVSRTDPGPVSTPGHEGNPLDEYPTLNAEHTGMIGRYRLMRQLGRGGMGVVFEAEDPDLGRRVALKLLPAGRFVAAETARRFIHEARAVARLRHPDIVPVLDIGRSSDGPFFTMAMVDGPTLAQRLADDGAFPWRDAAVLAARVARALDHAHARGVVHRDVKPGNILLEGGTEPRVVDFGLAFDTDTNQTLTRDGKVLGTPAYMSPEQASGQRDRIGRPTDVYALGVVLYEMLTGRVAYDGPTEVAILQQVVNGPPPADPRDANPDIPAALVSVCARAMARQPEDRYATAADLARDLEMVAAGVSPTIGGRSAWLVDHRRRRAQLTVAVVLLAMCLFAIASLVGSATRIARREDQAAARWVVVGKRVEELLSERRFDEAVDTTRAFSREDGQRGTQASSRAWARVAERLALNGRMEAARDAWVQAFVEVSNETLQANALVGLAQVSRADWDLAGWRGALRALEDVEPDRLRDPVVARLAADLRLSLRRTEAADQGDRLFAELARAAPAAPGAGAVDKAFRWDPEGDGTVGWFGWVDGVGLSRLDGDTQEPVALMDAPAELHLVHPIEVLSAPGMRGRLVLVASDGTARAWEWSPDGLRRLPHDLPRVFAATAADLDGNGAAERYLALWGRVVRWEEDGTFTDVEPDTTGAGAMVSDLDAADLDQDGRQELLVAAGEWTAYDIRVLEQPPGGPVGLIGRMKLGAMEHIVTWRGPTGPGVVVEKNRRYPSRIMFPPGAPGGKAEGLWIVGFRPDGRLSDLHHLASGIAATHGQPWSVDLDGDGVDEIAAWFGEDTVIYRLEQDGWRSWLLPGVNVLAAGDADGDGDGELLVRLVSDQEAPTCWWLGTGTGTLPPLTPPGESLSVDPSVASGADGERWQRALLLSRVGLLAEAAGAFRELARMSDDVVAIGQALSLAGHLYDAANQHDVAGATWTEAAERGALGAEAWKAAAASWRRAGRPDEELAALAQQDLLSPASADRARLDALSILTPRAVSWSEDFTDALDGDWQIRSPVGARRDSAAKVLIVDALPGDLLARPVTWDGGPLVVEVELEWEILDWSATLVVAVHGDGDQRWGVGLHGHGGGGLVESRGVAYCGIGFYCAFGMVDQGRRTTLRYVFLPDEPLVALSATSDGVELWRKPQDHRLKRFREGEAWFSIRAEGEGPARVRAKIHGIRVSGAALRASPSGADGSSGWRGLVEGRPAEVTDPVGRAVVLASRGQIADAWSQLRGTSLQETLLTHYLRVAPAGWMPILRASGGEDLATRMAEAWSLVLERPADDPELRVLGLDLLAGWEALEPPRGRAAMHATAALLRARARAAVEAGEADLAEAVLARLSGIIRRVPEAAAPTDALVFAQVAMLRGDEPAALEHLRRALQQSPSRTVMADRIRALPVFAPLQRLDGWSEISVAAFGPYPNP